MDFKTTIQQTFAPFADPATELKIVDSVDGLIFHFFRNGEDRTGRATKDNSGITWIVPTGKSKMALPAFLASDDMAGLDKLARTQISLYERNLPWDDWVAGPATIRSGDSGDETFDDSLAAINYAAVATSQQTKVVVLDGPAGMGKTSLVERMAHAHARAFRDRARVNLTLIISSRGRKLSRLNDAIAATLQDLRAGLFVSVHGSTLHDTATS